MWLRRVLWSMVVGVLVVVGLGVVSGAKAHSIDTAGAHIDMVGVGAEGNEGLLFTPVIITDTTAVTAINDGTVNVGEYPVSSSGINSGFANILGTNSTLYMDTSAEGDLNIGLEAGGAIASPLAVVIYIDTDGGATGFNSTGTFNDVGDQCRRAISGFDGSNRATINFATGFSANYAICLDNSFAGLWGLAGTGSHPFVVTANRTNVGADEYEMSLSLANLGLTNGDSFRYVATLLDQIPTNRSDEFHGVAAYGGGNPGTATVNLGAGDFNTFYSYINVAPVATDGEYTTAEDTAVMGNIISEDSGYGVDSDVNGDPLAVYTNTNPITGSLVLNNNGDFQYTPPLNWFGVATFTYGIQEISLGGTVASEAKISSTAGGFTGILDDFERFGAGFANIGDLDGDGVTDIAVGAYADDDGGVNRGAVWILFLNNNGTVKGHQKISDMQGGFTGILDDSDLFGLGIVNLGDLDGDMVTDIGVSAFADDDGGTDRGAIWILFLNSDGTVKGHQKISDTQGGFTGVLTNNNAFGAGRIDTVGDLDGDGVVDIAVPTYRDDDGGIDRGAVWILFLNNDGTVKGHQKISDTQGGFTGVLDDVNYFGRSVANLGDVDGDSITDIAVGANLDDDGGAYRGAVWILFLNSNGTVKGHQKISDTVGGFTGVLDNADYFGTSVASLGDVDQDGVVDIAVGAMEDDDGGLNRGAVWVLFLNNDGTVKGHQKISDTVGGFGGALDDNDYVGINVTSLGDLNGDGVVDMAVSADADDDGGLNRGVVWLLFMNGPAGGVSNMATVTVTVTAVNDNPVATNNYYLLEVGTVVTGSAVMDDAGFGVDYDPDTPVRKGTALDLDGGNDYIDTNGQLFSDTACDQPYTIEAWVNTSDASGVIMAQWGASNQFALRLIGGNLVWQKGGVSVATSAATVNDGSWHHVAGVRDGAGNVSLYIDGAVDGTGTDSTCFAASNTLIGTQLPSFDALAAQIEEIHVWDIARSGTDIFDTRRGTWSGGEPGLAVYYPLNDGAGSTATNLAGDTNGTLVGMAADDWVESTAPIGWTAAVVTPPIVGTLIFTPDGGFHYTPPPALGGVVSFTYTLDDQVTSFGPSAEAIVWLNYGIPLAVSMQTAAAATGGTSGYVWWLVVLLLAVTLVAVGVRGWRIVVGAGRR
ncbi:MAG TPA: Ig-like domain-containing protein [Anaerolineae bacterium]|nr:Ig-like domain-containing protein [Anaerolineae bacterium]